MTTMVPWRSEHENEHEKLSEREFMFNLQFIMIATDVFLSINITYYTYFLSSDKSDKLNLLTVIMNTDY